MRNRLSSKPEESKAQLRDDFEMATRQQLTHQWWSDDPMAAALRGCEKMGLAPSRHASFPGNLNRCEVPVPIFSQSLREHARETLPRVAEAIGTRLESLVRHLLTLPTQLATALLLTLFICLDMLHLRESLSRLPDSRIGHFYNEIVPGLVVFARLIGRSFSAQALIAVFNTLLTLLLLWLLGIENELLLCVFVFVGSFIPVLGVLLASIPIATQAVLQPDGSIVLALQAIAGILLIHFIEASFLSPKIVGKVLHLHPVVVLIILVIGAEVGRAPRGIAPARYKSHGRLCRCAQRAERD